MLDFLFGPVCELKKYSLFVLTVHQRTNDLGIPIKYWTLISDRHCIVFVYFHSKPFSQ